MKIISSIRIAAVSLIFAAFAFGQGGGRGAQLASLKTVQVPQPTNIGLYVRDQATLVTLGKALFWDTQVGSDGKTACASCHFHAGADHRLQNILGVPFSGSTALVVNQTVVASTFLFHQLANLASNSSQVVKDTRQVAGSPGVFHRTFFGVEQGSSSENGSDIVGGASSLGGVNVRPVWNPQFAIHYQRCF